MELGNPIPQWKSPRAKAMGAMFLVLGFGTPLVVGFCGVEEAIMESEGKRKLLDCSGVYGEFHLRSPADVSITTLVSCSLNQSCIVAMETAMFSGSIRGSHK